jgi:GT2 family glycosyltransferase
LLNADGSIQVSSIKRVPTILNQVCEAEYLQTHWPQCPLWSLTPLFQEGIGVVPVDVIPGACMLLRHTVFAQVGMLSEEYFMYAEDLDLNAKIHGAGLTNYYVGVTALVHYGGGSSSRQKVSHWATVMQCRAMVRYFRKTRGRYYERLYRTTLGIAAFLRLVLLGVSAAFGNLLLSREVRRNAWTKWATVLKWTIGIGEPKIVGQS